MYDHSFPNCFHHFSYSDRSYIKIRLEIALILFLLIAILGVSLAHAAPLSTQNQNIESTNPQIQPLRILSLSPEDQAKRWGLSIEQYQHYEWLMQHTPSGKWYPNLDPAEVLGLNAKDDNEMMQYAKIVAQNTHDRVMRELVFDRAYRLAYQKLYPKEKPIMSSVSQ